MTNKQAQVSVFIIIAVVLIAGVIAYFLIAEKKIIQEKKPSISEPDAYIEKCTKDAAIEAVNILLEQGGQLEPGNYKLFNETRISYLCYTNQYYKNCVMQEPMLLKHLESEITSYVAPKVDECFNEIADGLKDDGYETELSDMEIETELGKGFLRIGIERDFSMSRNEEQRKFRSFNSITNSPLRKLAETAVEIANQESKYCNFEYIGFMLLYPEFNIERKDVGSGEGIAKIYIIKDKYSGKALNIAVRSCAVPPGT